jgi:outer membrane protein, multidrug efflux system
MAAFCGACAVKPAPLPPANDVPREWGVEVIATGTALTSEWFRGFHSEELNGLIASAYSNNADFLAAGARVRQADARARAAGAALLPDVSAGANGAFFAGHSRSGSVNETDYAALLSASYESDFWGKNRAGQMSAFSLREASQADQAVVALSTVTGVANTYFQVVELSERVDFAKQSLANSKQLLQIVEARYAAKLANPVEVAQQRSAVAAADIHVKEVEQQKSEQEATLAILVGKMPGAVSVSARLLADFTVPRVAPGLPPELLMRRPDILAAEATLQSAHADLVRARAAFFPSVTLTASTGLANPSVAAAVQTLTGLGPTMTLGADLVQSIFNGGRLRAARDEALGKQEEMLAHYRGAVLAALWDVETALAAIEHLDLQEHAQEQSIEQSERAVEGALARYQAGSGDYLTVLEAQRVRVSVREQWSQYQLARLQASVGLCKALGGGWAQKH